MKTKKTKSTALALPPGKPDSVQPKATRAELTLDPAANAAMVVDAYGEKVFGEQSLAALAKALGDSIAAVEREGLGPSEAMLVSQASALQSMFVNLAKRAAQQDRTADIETFTRLALKAQRQCRETIEALAMIKNPPGVSIVRQANIANQMQVNNGVPLPAARVAYEGAGELEVPQTKLFEADHGNRLDSRAACSHGSAHSPVAPVGAINRAED